LNTLIETISATGQFLAPFLIMNGKRRMDYFFTEELDENAIIATSESGYSNNELGLAYIQHFIEQSKSSDSSKKLLIFDGYESHISDEFQEIAYKNNVILLQFPAHLTHILQPLDVGVFGPYKHWHTEAIHTALRTLQPR
jgi:hypothetical protein